MAANNSLTDFFKKGLKQISGVAQPFAALLAHPSVSLYGILESSAHRSGGGLAFGTP